MLVALPSRSEARVSKLRIRHPFGSIQRMSEGSFKIELRDHISCCRYDHMKMSKLVSERASERQCSFATNWCDSTLSNDPLTRRLGFGFIPIYLSSDRFSPLNQAQKASNLSQAYPRAYYCGLSAVTAIQHTQANSWLLLGYNWVCFRYRVCLILNDIWVSYTNIGSAVVIMRLCCWLTGDSGDASISFPWLWSRFDQSETWFKSLKPLSRAAGCRLQLYIYIDSKKPMKRQYLTSLDLSKAIDLLPLTLAETVRCSGFTS